jgi:hypothetical protein
MKTIYIVILLVIILIASFSVYFSHRQKTSSKLDESFCDEIISDQLNDICHVAFSKDANSCENVGTGYNLLCYNVVVNALDVSESVCNSINNSYGKILCDSRLAIKLKNPEMCGFDFNCYTELAVLTKNYSICNYAGIDSEKYKCMAKSSGSLEYCNSIEDDIEKKNCEQLLPKKIEDCQIGDYYNYDCLLELAYQEKNSYACNLMSREELKWSCIVDAVNNPEVCSNATDIFADLCRIEYLKNNLNG